MTRKINFFALGSISIIGKMVKTKSQKVFGAKFYVCRSYRGKKLIGGLFVHPPPPHLCPHWCKISRPYLVPVPHYWTWTKTTKIKKWCFWSNPCKIEVMITSPTKMLELPTLVTWPHLEYNLSHVIKFYWWRHGQKLRLHNLYFKILLF